MIKNRLTIAIILLSLITTHSLKPNIAECAGFALGAWAAHRLYTQWNSSLDTNINTKTSKKSKSNTLPHKKSTAMKSPSLSYYLTLLVGGLCGSYLFGTGVKYSTYLFSNELPKFDNPFSLFGDIQTIEDVKRSYKKLALQYHPDKNRDKSAQEMAQITEQFNKIKEAYDFLIVDSSITYDCLADNSIKNKISFWKKRSKEERYVQVNNIWFEKGKALEKERSERLHRLDPHDQQYNELRREIITQFNEQEHELNEKWFKVGKKLLIDGESIINPA